MWQRNDVWTIFPTIVVCTNAVAIHWLKLSIGIGL